MIKKNYRLFLVSDLISQFGAGMIMAALSWFIITNNGSNQLLATTTNINIMSGLIVSIFAGTIVDRYKNKNVIISTHFIRLLLIILPVILMNSFGYNSIFLFMIALSNGIGWNIYFPASKSFIQELAEDKELIKFNSWAEITMQIGLFSSGALAGSLYKFIGFQNILIFSSLSFVVSIICVFMIKIEHKNITIASTEKFTSLLKGGFIYLSQHKILFAYGLILYIPFIGANIFNIALPGYVSNHLGESSAVFGLIDMFYGIGACIAGLLVITLTKKFSIYKLLQIMFLTGVVCGILFYINDKVVFSIILTLIIGFCGPSIRTIINTIVMEKVPNQILGRVISAWSILSSFIQIVVTFILGKVMDYYGSNWGFLFYSLIMAVALIICYFIKYSLEVQNEKSNNY